MIFELYSNGQKITAIRFGKQGYRQIYGDRSHLGWLLTDVRYGPRFFTPEDGPIYFVLLPRNFMRDTYRDAQIVSDDGEPVEVSIVGDHVNVGPYRLSLKSSSKVS